jgi:hypothetical protein
MIRDSLTAEKSIPADRGFPNAVDQQQGSISRCTSKIDPDICFVTAIFARGGALDFLLLAFLFRWFRSRNVLMGGFHRFQ